MTRYMLDELYKPCKTALGEVPHSSVMRLNDAAISVSQIDGKGKASRRQALGLVET